MKILFLNPPSLKQERYMKEIGRCGRRAVAGELWPQTGLAYLAAVVREEGHEPKIVDAMAEALCLNDLIQRIKDWPPALLVANITTPTFNNDVRVIKELKKEFDFPIVFSGTHPSALPEESIGTGVVDYVLINEAEETLVELAGLLAQNLKGDTDFEARLAQIKGLGFKNSAGKMVITPPRAYIEPLDNLPFPARDLLPNHLYRMPFFEKAPFVTVIPTRGCPWPCTFCRAGRVWGRKVRTRTVDNVLSEIRHVINDLRIAKVIFMTDSLTLNRRWAMLFFQAILDYNVKFDWICNSRVDAVDPQMLKLMKQAGCKLISYGIESGSQEILDRCKKSIKLEDSRRAIQMTRQAGIISMAYFIFGLPGETHDTVEQTIGFMKELAPDYINVHIATPFPGTELYDIARENDWLVSDNWDDYEEEGSAVVRTEELSVEDLVRAQKRAMRQFYLRPSRLFKELLAIRRPAQLRARINAGLNIINTLFRKSPRPTHTQ